MEREFRGLNSRGLLTQLRRNHYELELRLYVFKITQDQERMKYAKKRNDNLWNASTAHTLWAPCSNPGSEQLPADNPCPVGGLPFFF